MAGSTAEAPAASMVVMKVLASIFRFSFGLLAGYGALVIIAAPPLFSRPGYWPTPTPTLSSVNLIDGRDCKAYVMSLDSNDVRCVVWYYAKGKHAQKTTRHR